MFKKKLPMKSILTTTFLFVVLLTYSQEVYVIDLADGRDKETSRTVQSGVPFKILIKNKVLNTDYSISVQRKFQLLEQLALDAKENNVSSMETTENCLINKLTNDLTNSHTEKEVGSIAYQLKQLLIENDKERKSGNDTICTPIDIAKAWYAISQTEQALNEQKLKKGEYLEVTISRRSTEDESKMVVWKNIYTTQKKGKWLTTYGFAFIPEIMKKSEPYFSKQNDTTFTITELNRRSRLNFAPSIFFTWFPYKRAASDFALTFTGGLGYDFEAPTVFLGGSLLYNQNIGISVGLTAHQQEFLNGRYEEGDVLSENLGEEQLNEKLYGINPFISVNFRLGASPFKGSNPLETTED